MGSGSPKRVGRVVATLLAVFAGILVILQLVLNSQALRSRVDRILSESINADCNYSSLRFSLLGSFPGIRVSVDDFSVSYPHERYSRYDSLRLRSRLLDAGRGETADTLLRFRNFSARVNPWHILAGRVRLSDVTLSGLGVYAHSYGSEANWQVFGSSAPADSVAEDSSGLNLPWISLGKIRLDGNPRIVYTDRADTLLASVRMNSISLGGAVKLGNVLKLRRMSLYVDSLRVRGRLPSDTLAFSLDSLSLGQSGKLFTLGADARAMVRSRAFGHLRIPASLNSSFVFEQSPERTLFDLQSLNLDIAKIPFSASGTALVYPDSTALTLKAGIEELHLQPLLRDYLDKMVASAQEIDTDAVLSLDLDAAGTLTDSSIPEVEFRLSMPRCSLGYAPLDINGRAALECSAHATPGKYLTLDMETLELDVPGLVASLSGKGYDLLGADPVFAANGNAGADLAALVRYLPEDSGIDADGRISMHLDGSASLRQLKTYTADLKACVMSDTLSVRMGPGMALQARAVDFDLHNSTRRINFETNFHPLEGSLTVDRLRFEMDTLRFALAGSRTDLNIEQAEYRGSRTPRLRLTTDNSRMFLRYGVNRVGAKGVHVEAGMTRRQRSAQRRKARLDSLQRVYPGVERDSLWAVARRNSGNAKRLYAQEQSWASKDISVTMDSSATRFLRDWSPRGRITVEGARIATPILPLENRLTALDAGFDENALRLSELSLRSGTTSLSAKGSVLGLRRALLGRDIFRADLTIDSPRVNFNELLAAFQAGKVLTVDIDDDNDDSYEASFVTDTLSGAEVSTEDIGLIVVPSNVEAVFNLNVDKVDYSDLDISSLKARAEMKDRCVQLTDARLLSDAGKIGLDAFYSTRSKQDISAGFNLSLSDVSASKIIGMLPSVEDMMPVLKSFKGNLDCSLTATSQLDTNMNLVIPTLDGVFKISGKELFVEDAGDLRKITGLLLFKNRNIGCIEDLDFSAFVHDSRVEVFPFILGVDRYKLALCGIQGFDSSFNYHISILKTPLPIRFGINLYGTPQKWRFSLGRARYKDGKVPVFTSQLDTMQVNIVKSIRHIYRRGVKAAMEENGRRYAEIDRYKAGMGYRAPDGDEMLSTAEYCQIDSIQFAMEIEQIDREIIEEVDKILDETFASAEILRKEFDEMFFDKKLLRKQERQARRDARKASRARK